MNNVLKQVRKTLGHLLPWRLRHHIYRRLAARYIDNLDVSVDPDKDTLLIINHFYDQDIRALMLANSDFNLVVVDAPTLFRGARIYFPWEVVVLEAPYEQTDPYRREIYREECRRIFERLRRRVDFKAMITASDIFYWIRELIDVAHEQDVKTIVLDKEGTRSPYGYNREYNRIKRNAPFISDHICVWSERQRQFWRKIGVPDDRITVVGQPRSDLFLREDRQQVDSFFFKPRPLVTLFSYEDTAYVPPGLVPQGYSWRQMKQETHDTLAALAQAHPDYNFVVKTHPQQSDLTALQDKYDSENLRVLGGSAIANELIKRSELIIAFQTTSVIEAMYLNRPVIYTNWDPTISDLIDHLLPFHQAGGIRIANSLSEFRDFCDRFFGRDQTLFQFSPEEQQRRKAFVDQFVYRPDGHVCERFFAAVREVLS